MNSRDIEAVYDAVADRYAEQFGGELDHKPFDRARLDRLVGLVAGRGPIADMGCGPGQVAAYLRRRGAEVLGIDCAAAMLDQARARNPGIEFRRDDLLDLRLRSDSLGGIAAFYAIVHFDLDQVETACREFRRVLVPGGVALIAFHIGDGTRLVEEFLGRPIAARFAFFQPDDVVARLRAAGLELEEETIRSPDEQIEYPSQRAYILARKPARSPKPPLGAAALGGPRPRGG